MCNVGGASCKHVIDKRWPQIEKVTDEGDKAFPRNAPKWVKRMQFPDISDSNELLPRFDSESGVLFCSAASCDVYVSGTLIAKVHTVSS